jgi:hypothetical protein
MGDSEHQKSEQFKARLLRAFHVLLYVILIGVVVFVYLHAKNTYDKADPQNSYIQCVLNNDQFSLSTLGATGEYTIKSTTLAGNGTGDDLLAHVACGPAGTNVSTVTQDSFKNLDFGYNVHFVHNDTMSPLEEAGVVFGVGVIVIEIINALFKYVVFGKWTRL